MRALRSFGPKDIRVVDVDPPEPSDDKVIVDVEWCGICGSDLALYHLGPQLMFSLPAAAAITMGHEFWGRVAHAPANSPFQAGQPVTIDPRLYCSACGPCAANETQGCTRGLTFVGFVTHTGGGFAEQVALDPQLLHALPASANLAAAALIEPLSVAWHAVRIAGVRRGGGDGEDAAVLVVGGGPVGVAVCYVLRAWGLRDRVLVSEPGRARREMLLKAGLADAVFDPREEKVAERVRELTGGAGARFVFDCAGFPAALVDAFDSIAFQGSAVVVALHKGTLPVPFRQAMNTECTIKTSCAFNGEDFREVLEAFSEGKFKGVENMITSRISLEDVVEKGFEALDKPDTEHVKIFITPKKSNLA